MRPTTHHYTPMWELTTSLFTRPSSLRRPPELMVSCVKSSTESPPGGLRPLIPLEALAELPPGLASLGMIRGGWVRARALGALK